MRRTSASVLLLIASALLSSCAEQAPPTNTVTEPENDPRVERLMKQRDAVVKYFQPMAIRDGDWLQTQRESGETFEQYIASGPTLPTAERRTIYVQPIGRFTAEQRKAIRLAADYMRAFYSLPVELLADRQLGNVPAEFKRKAGYPPRDQIRTQYFLDDVLPKMLRDDAAALIAFTNYDVYPEDTWFFVFGQAALQKRVGVWSLYRLNDVALESDNQKDRLLFRTLKIAMHETGHMFSMRHCTKYECLMSGTNHLAETDRRPVDNCPECMAKLAWAMNYEPAERYEKLAEFWERQRRSEIAGEFRKKAEAVRAAVK